MTRITQFPALLLACAALSAQVRTEDQAAAAKAKQHFQANSAAYGLNTGNQLRETKSRADERGVTHIRFEQIFRNVSVFEGEAIAHVSPSGDVAVTDSIQKELTIDTTPRIGRGVALNIAIAGLQLRGTTNVESAALQVLARGPRGSTERLVWHFVLSVENEIDPPAHWDVFVDAITGGIAWKFDSLETAAAVGTGRTMYSGNVRLATSFDKGTYTLPDTYDLKNTQGGKEHSVVDFANDFGNNQRDSSDPDTAAADAHYGLATTLNFYLNRFARNGIDGAGRPAYNRVHVGLDFENAFWSQYCFCMSYGDGASTFLPLVSLDIAAHEITHGVTQSEANLTYAGESGGLNEATSDILGTLVEFYAANALDAPDYWIAERTFRSNWSTGSFVQTKALRYMDDPAKDGKSPACWSPAIGTLDVHYSSGPANHMFYLLAHGGTSKCNGNAVAGIGNLKAGAIWYKALTDYMTAGTNYSAARTAALNAAASLYGAGSSEHFAVAAAFSAIKVF